jgi:GNAT superfamily N-acetyltransferase
LVWRFPSPWCGISSDPTTGKFDVKHDVSEYAGDRPKSKWLHLWKVGVTPKARGRGVSTKLLKHSLELAKKKGFHFAIAECTSVESVRMSEKAGEGLWGQSFSLRGWWVVVVVMVCLAIVMMMVVIGRW